MDPHRTQRVSETLREELAEIIGYEMSDPRVECVDVTEVLIAPDMRRARVRIHLEADEQGQQEALRALDGARHYLRRELASRLRLYRVPELRFEADFGLSAGTRVNRLLKRIRKGRVKPDGSSGEEP